MTTAFTTTTYHVGRHCTLMIDELGGPSSQSVRPDLTSPYLVGTAAAELPIIALAHLDHQVVEPV
jgi:hypothetical protein